jgi:uncharacterized alkaline shock family protein YloU
MGEERKGTVHISEDVIASVAALAVSEVEGVNSLAAVGGVDISELLGKKNLAKGVKVTVNGETVDTDVFVLVKYGFPIQGVAQKIQANVRKALESMTGMNVGNINVHVNGIALETKKVAQ